jgi:hypothetical protein
MKIAGNNVDLADVAAVVFGLTGAVLGLLGWFKARESNKIADTSNAIARDSMTVAEQSNRIAVEANDIARDANRIVSDDVEYRRQREWESQRAVLEIPQDNPITWYTGKGPNAVIALHMVNKGAGDIRDLVMTVFDNEEPLTVEQGTIKKLTRDDGPDARRLQFLISYDAAWAKQPESHLIRAHFQFEDGTGFREEDHCFRFRGTDISNGKSVKVPCA